MTSTKSEPGAGDAGLLNTHLLGGSECTNSQKTDSKQDQPSFQLRLQAERRCADPIRALRALLKIALRRFGLRAVSVEETHK
jgi:hypothetical protein